MMKKIIVLTLALCLSQTLFSKVLIVRRFGYGGAFWNIEQAVDSASEGDTVYVDMRGETGYWGNSPVIRKNVTLSISDTSISLNTLSITTENFKIENVKIDYLEFNGNKIEVNGCFFVGGLEIKKGSCTINNCSMDYFMTYDTTSDINLFNSNISRTNNDGRCFLKGNNILVCGNKLGSNTTINGKGVTFNGNINQNSSKDLMLRIFSNELNITGNNISADRMFEFVLSGTCGEIKNNVFKKNEYTPIPYYLSFDRNSKFSITERDQFRDLPLLIHNNFVSAFFYEHGGANYPNTDSLFIINAQMVSSNIISFSSTFQYYNPQIYGSKKSIINAQFPRFSNWMGNFDSSNQVFTQNFSSFVLDSQYRLAFDTTLVTNRGFDDPAFSDLDLSRNDIGPLGGPTPITNYQNPGGAPKPQIWDVTLPRRTFSPSGPIPIKAVGTAK
jgi:hypothetical protein